METRPERLDRKKSDKKDIKGPPPMTLKRQSVTSGAIIQLEDGPPVFEGRSIKANACRSSVQLYAFASMIYTRFSEPPLSHH